MSTAEGSAERGVGGGAETGAEVGAAAGPIFSAHLHLSPSPAHLPALTALVAASLVKIQTPVLASYFPVSDHQETRTSQGTGK